MQAKTRLLGESDHIRMPCLNQACQEKDRQRQTHRERESKKTNKNIKKNCREQQMLRQSGDREEKSVHNHHRKKIIWRTFLASKKNFPGRWWIQNLIKTKKTISTAEIFPLWTPFFSAKKSSALEQGSVWCLFPREIQCLRQRSETVKSCFSKCRSGAELEKIGEKYSRRGPASQNKSKKPWASIFTLSP